MFQTLLPLFLLVCCSFRRYICRRVRLALGILQTKFRVMLSSRQEIRPRDIKGGWKITAPARAALLTLVYTLVLIYVATCVYILLIFGTIILLRAQCGLALASCAFKLFARVCCMPVCYRTCT